MSEGRVLSDWLQGYLEYTQEQESPEKLHLWTAFTVLSAALRRQVWMSRGHYKLYPNIYVLIVAESARIRKSTAMDIGMKLIQEALNGDVFYMKGKMTPEGLTSHLNRQSVIVDEETKQPKYRADSHILIHADELATLFGYEKTTASRMAILLTEIYGCPDEYPFLTKGEGLKKLFNNYPTIIAATDPRNLKVLPEEAVGGLIGRMIFISARDKRKTIAWPEPTTRELALREALKCDLEAISKLKGMMTPEEDAKALFKEWYEAMSKIELSDPRLDAFHERCHDTSLKLAMLISVSRSDSLTVTREHLAGAIAIIEKQLPEFSKVVNWASSSEYSQNRARLIDLIKRNGGVLSRRAAMRALTLNIEEIELLENSLTAEDILKTIATGKELLYKLTEDETK
jgi:hypothetical protein